MCKAVNKVFSIACKQGNLELVKNLLISFPKINISYSNNLPFRNACKEGHTDIVNFLLTGYPMQVLSNKNPVWYMKEFLKTCENDYLDCCALFLYNYLPEVEMTMSFHKRRRITLLSPPNQSAKIMWLVNRFPNIDFADPKTWVVIYLCETGNLPMIEWMFENFPDILKHTEYYFLVSCFYNKLDSMKFFLKKNPELENIFNQAMFMACKKDYYFIAEWLYNNTNQNLFTKDIFYNLVENKNIPLVLFMLDKAGFKGELSDLEDFFKPSHEAIMNVLIDKLECNKTTFYQACLSSSLNLIKKVYKKLTQKEKISLTEEQLELFFTEISFETCQWLAETFNYKQGSIQVLFNMCEEFGDLPKIQWYSSLINQNQDRTRCFIISCKKGNLQVAKWFYENFPLNLKEKYWYLIILEDKETKNWIRSLPEMNCCTTKLYNFFNV